VRHCLKKFAKHATAYPKATIFVWVVLVCLFAVSLYIDEIDAVTAISAIIGFSILCVPMKVFWLEAISSFAKFKRAISNHGLLVAFGVSYIDRGFFFFTFLLVFIAALFALLFFIPLLNVSL
jgi:hypothetical protein